MDEHIGKLLAIIQRLRLIGCRLWEMKEREELGVEEGDSSGQSYSMEVWDGFVEQVGKKVDELEIGLGFQSGSERDQDYARIYQREGISSQGSGNSGDDVKNTNILAQLQDIQQSDNSFERSQRLQFWGVCGEDLTYLKKKYLEDSSEEDNGQGDGGYEASDKVCYREQQVQTESMGKLALCSSMQVRVYSKKRRTVQAVDREQLGDNKEGMLMAKSGGWSRKTEVEHILEGFCLRPRMKENDQFEANQNNARYLSPKIWQKDHFNRIDQKQVGHQHLLNVCYDTLLYVVKNVQILLPVGYLNELVDGLRSYQRQVRDHQQRLSMQSMAEIEGLCKKIAKKVKRVNKQYRQRRFMDFGERVLVKIK